MKYFRTYINVLLTLAAIFSFLSCTVLQWRSSDLEIQEKFDKRKVKTDISYYDIDSLNLQIRVQTVLSENSNINLVFFHGSPSSLSAWDGYLLDSTLRRNATMYAIDRPGYGYSNFGSAMTSIEQQADIMDALIDNYKLTNVIVIGSSYGGPLAARIGYLNNRVKAIMLISPAIDPNNEKDIWASRFTRWKITRWIVPTSYRVAGDEKELHAQELGFIEDDWSKMNKRVYHLHGTTDDIVPYINVEFSKQNFQNVEIITFENKGHEIAWKNPELIIPYILKLIQEVE